MKFLIVTIFAILAVAALAKEQTNISWSKVKSVIEHIPNENRRIYGGNTATKFQFPYQAGLILSKSKIDNVCGGAIISSTRVLSAAHCFVGVLSVLVILGARILDVEETTQVRINVPLKGIVVHPKYDDDTLHNDVAMIKLPSAVKFNDNISPIALPEGTNNYVDNTGVIAGWGHFDDSKTDSLFLRFANLKILKNSYCKERVQFVIDSTLCAKGQGNTDGCNGDSGQI